MFYSFYELQRLALGPLLGALRMPPGAAGWQRPFWAWGEVLARSAEAGEARPVPVEAAVAHDLGGPLEAAEVASTPFVRVVRMRRPGGPSRPILLAAPHSGYAAAVMSPLAIALLGAGEVWVTDWIDARLVPAGEGRFGLAEQTALLAGLARELGGRAHLVGVSQSVVPLMAAAIEGGAASLVLLGGPADPRPSPTPLQQALALLPPGALEQQSVTTVPPRYPGAGRRVFPAVLQLMTYATATPATYLDVQSGLLAELSGGKGNGYDRQHADLHRLLDVPAELFVETLEHAVRTPLPLPDGDGLRGVPVLTVEAGADGLVGPGQTHAAHARLARLGARAMPTTTVPDAAHHELFTGPRLGREIGPLLRTFYAAADG
ncbi:MAG: hypothetical protein U1E14_13360 [Geminicoccaceae bacterium]